MSSAVCSIPPTNRVAGRRRSASNSLAGLPEANRWGGWERQHPAALPRRSVLHNKATVNGALWCTEARMQCTAASNKSCVQIPSCVFHAAPLRKRAGNQPYACYQYIIRTCRVQMQGWGGHAEARAARSTNDSRQMAPASPPPALLCSHAGCPGRHAT